MANRVETCYTSECDERSRAFTRLYKTMYRLAFATAYRVLGDRADAEDVAADTFEKLWRRAPVLTSPAAAAAWVAVTARNGAINIYRRRARIYYATDSELEFFIGSDTHDRRSDDDALSDISECVRNLPQRYKRALLRWCDGYTLEEIGVLENTSATGAWRDIRNAVADVKRQYFAE